MNEPLWYLIISAFLGGVILNFMPCVLPVLAVKFYSLSKRSAHDRHKEGWLYSLGVMTTFLLLGGGFLALRLAGEQIGWGYQLQNPLVIVGLIFLFWFVGFYFLGVFEVGYGLMNFSSKYLHDSGSFLTGALSVFVAAPCTGPFMGSALGAAALLSPIASLAIFASLGLGLCFPFLLFSLQPRLSVWLPKPGAWMEKLKEFFAFPMFATSLWLAWVLERQLGAVAWLILSVSFLGLSFCIWLFKMRTRSSTILAFLGFALSLTAAFHYTVVARRDGRANTRSQGSAADNGGGNGVADTSGNTIAEAGETSGDSRHPRWQKFSGATVQQMRTQHKSVFIDFTASWCVTCQINKKTTLDLDSTMELFHLHQTELFVADWTDEDPEITRTLAQFQRNSVPLYVYYAPDKEAVILPQILTYSILQDLFK